tara:strand:+ start:1297 stop:1452 length:156 start_codon:yes stop_codon:yes gene_type:complete
MADIDYAVREAYTMQLSTEQSIKFVMTMANVDRDSAKRAIQTYQQQLAVAH